MLLGDLAGRRRMLGVAVRDFVGAGDGFLQGPERQQPFARPAGYRLKPVSCTSTGLPDARYRTLRSLNQPQAVSTYIPWAAENSAPEPCT